VDGGRLVAWKAAFGGALVAAITSTSPIQLVTVQPGNRLLTDAHDRTPSKFASRTLTGTSRVVRGGVELNDDLGVLEAAQAVVGVGTGVPQDEYHLLRPLLDAFGAELAATRRVADNGWLPRARQLGITGRSIGPNHMVGVRRAEFVLAINNDPTAPVFDFADAGIVGDWHEVVPVLAAHAVSGAAVGGSGLVV
jgi:electron transfer flavoprotein alpha subunit